MSDKTHCQVCGKPSTGFHVAKGSITPERSVTPVLVCEAHHTMLKGTYGCHCEICTKGQPNGRASRRKAGPRSETGSARKRVSNAERGGGGVAQDEFALEPREEIESPGDSSASPSSPSEPLTQAET